MRGAIGLRDIQERALDSGRASWPCEKLDWGAMETDLSNQLLYSIKIFVMNRVCKGWRMTILKLFN